MLARKLNGVRIGQWALQIRKYKNSKSWYLSCTDFCKSKRNKFQGDVVFDVIINWLQLLLHELLWESAITFEVYCHLKHWNIFHVIWWCEVNQEEYYTIRKYFHVNRLSWTEHDEIKWWTELRAVDSENSSSREQKMARRLEFAFHLPLLFKSFESYSVCATFLAKYSLESFENNLILQS